MNGSNNNYKFKLNFQVLRQKSMLTIYNSWANFHINDLTNTYSKYVTCVIFPSTNCFPFIWYFLKHLVNTVYITLVFLVFLYLTVYQLQQEAPRPKRVICPREVSSTFSTSFKFKELSGTCWHCWSSPFLCTAFLLYLTACFYIFQGELLKH